MTIEDSVIYNEDCLVGMKRIADESIDMILCDLPYGTTACRWDEVIPFEPLWEAYRRIIKPNGAIVLTASQPFTSRLVSSNYEMFRYEWIWEKEQGVNFLQAKKQPMKVHENILIFSRGQTVYHPIMTEGKPYISGKGTSGEVTNHVVKVQTVNEGKRYPKSVQRFNRQTGLHPTQKPVPLFEYLIQTYTSEGDIVLDNCMGSGTTAIACINTGRRYIGFESDAKYYEIAMQRVAETVENRGDLR